MSRQASLRSKHVKALPDAVAHVSQPILGHAKPAVGAAVQICGSSAGRPKLSSRLREVEPQLF